MPVYICPTASLNESKEPPLPEGTEYRILCDRGDLYPGVVFQTVKPVAGYAAPTDLKPLGPEPYGDASYIKAVKTLTIAEKAAAITAQLKPLYDIDATAVKKALSDGGIQTAAVVEK